jgi:hypothetical protein
MQTRDRGTPEEDVETGFSPSWGAGIFAMFCRTAG